MINYVIINGVNSNTITGLMINELPPITKPQMRAMQEEIDGRDGDITTNLGYSAYDKTITIGLFGTGYDINNIVAFFNGEGTIVFSNEADKYYNFKILNQIDYVALQKFKSASITFHCQPFKYPLTETPLEIEYTYIEDEGESLTLNNTGEATLKLDLKGQCKQDSTTGKNLLNNTVASTTLANVTITKNSDGSITLNGTANDQANTTIGEVSFESGEAYTISGVTGFTDSTLQIYTASTTAFPSGSRLQSYNGAVTRTAQATETCFIKLYVYPGTQYNNVKVYPMIVKGSTSGEYEPYTGGQPSPSPDHPQQIHEVSGDNEINVEGKNLFDISTITENKTIDMANGNVNVSTNDRNTSDYIMVEENSKYTCNQIMKRFAFYDSSKTFISSNINGDTITTPNNAKYIRFSYDNSLSNIQLEKGQTSTPYEPYQSQTYPINLGTLKMRGIGTYEDYFVRNSGKQLLDPSLISDYTTSTGITISHNSAGEIVLNGTASGQTNINTLHLDIPQGITKISISGGTSSVSYACNTYTSDDTYIGVVRDSGTPQTYELPSNASKYELNIRVAYGTTLNNYVVRAMFNEGEPTYYEPFGKDMWCKYNAIGKVICDGSADEDWSYNGEYNFFQKPYTNIDTTILGYCDYYKPVQTVASGDYGFTFYQYSGTKYIRVRNIDYSNISDFINWLKAHDTTFNYVLETPYLSLIEDNNLIEQLDNLQNAMSYEGQTNVSQVNDDLPFNISAKALEQGSNEVVVNNIGNAYSKPLIALEGSGNIDIYLNNTQILKANVEDKMNIDIAKLEAYNPDTSALLNRQVTGNYNSMTLQPGESTIRIDGALDKATISNYTRWL